MERNRPPGRPQQWLAGLIEAIEHLRLGDRRIDIRHRRLERELALLARRSAATDVISFTIEATRKIVSRVITGPS